jgi:hypothetical protein
MTFGESGLIRRLLLYKRDDLIRRLLLYKRGSKLLIRPFSPKVIPLIQ